MSYTRRTTPVNDVFTPAMLPSDYPNFDGSQSCAHVTNKDRFFPSSHDNATDPKKVCRGCQFQQPCGEYALLHEDAQGVWGAMSERDRRRLRRKLTWAS